MLSTVTSESLPWYLGEQQQRVAVLQLPVVRGDLRLGVGLLSDDGLRIRRLALLAPVRQVALGTLQFSD